MGVRNAEKSRISMNQFDQQERMYYAFCWKIKIKLHENLSPMQTPTHAPESEITYGRD